MFDRIGDLFRATGQVFETLVDYAAAIEFHWIFAAVALHIVSQAVRTIGWWAIIRAAYPDAIELRRSDVIAAYFAGAGLNAVVPARGGDVVKLYFVHRRIPRSRYSTLLATFVPETLFETLFGIGLVVWALGNGFLPVPTAGGELPQVDVTLYLEHPFIAGGITAGVIALVVLLVRRLQRTGRAHVERLKRGMEILRRPREYLTAVVPWQALGRVIRLGSLACFMAAFGLPVTFETVVLVMAAQGGGRIIPVAPVSAGLRLAMLSFGFVEVTGEAVDIGRITAFTVGTGTVHLVVGLAISALIIFRTLGTLSPRRAVHAAREALGQARARTREASGVP